jgi:hypothetical protein
VYQAQVYQANVYLGRGEAEILYIHDMMESLIRLNPERKNTRSGVSTSGKTTFEMHISLVAVGLMVMPLLCL